MSLSFSSRIYLGILSILIVVAIAGCKKGDQSLAATALISENQRSAVKNWLSVQQSISKDTAAFNQIVANLDWLNGNITNYTETTFLLTIPITMQLTVAKVSSLLYKTSSQTKDFLVILLTSQETVTQGNIVQITPAVTSSLKTPIQLVADILNETNANFNGSFTMMTLETEFMYEYIFSNNKKSAESRIKGAPKTEKHRFGLDMLETMKDGATKKVNGGVRTNDEYCLDWYLITTWEDGSVSISYLFTQCGLCDANGIGPKGTFQTVKVLCSGGGGGGSNPVEYDRTTFRYLEDIPSIQGNDSVKVRGTVEFHASGGRIDGATWHGSQGLWMDSRYYTYIESWNEAVFSNTSGRGAFIGTVYGNEQSYPVSKSQTYSYQTLFP